MAKKIPKIASYTADPSIFYERALELQKKKIESQALELSRMNRVYSQSVKTTKISEALKFLISIIINKIKK